MESRTTYELADIGERFIALVIDNIILGIIGGIFGVGTNAIWGGGLLAFAVGAAYQWYFLTQQNGQTPGKMALNIRVIKTDGSQISDADAVLRFFGYYVNSVILMFGWIWAMLDSNNQGLHDKLANTYVVKVAPVKSKNDEIMVR